MTNDFLSSRAGYSRTRLSELKDQVGAAVEGVELEGLTIFTAGSFARLEAGEFSDVDLFFTYHPTGNAVQSRRTNELKLFGRLIDLVEKLGFPAFSNDAQYLETHNVEDILKYLGGPIDDAHNHFTLRMLLLLESKCIYGKDEYEAALKNIIQSYYRDFPRHEHSFQPWFLLNDIMRYWKTLLLNYENKRNDGDSEEAKLSRRVKNFKLQFSRMTTCFATIAALGSFSDIPTEEDVFQLTLRTPQDRLQLVKDKLPELNSTIESLLSEYSWFLEQTSLSTEALRAKFVDRDDRTQMFSRAEAYGSKMFGLLDEIGKLRGMSPDLIRYLVI
ncbi:nucleotidyltransferase domain-containing protein [Cryobacterium sp. Y82]|uniref:nucleotidyltransferase domain-containing protein n=1 Tax=Cryobacterium sp. Y82 TaxID=2045017 RepID=UPI000CE51D07|nr:nucleotidyltransferase domain-containing protein [Cryobacterium sp. Y82]